LIPFPLRPGLVLNASLPLVEAPLGTPGGDGWGGSSGALFFLWRTWRVFVSPALLVSNCLSPPPEKRILVLPSAGLRTPPSSLFFF